MKLPLKLKAWELERTDRTTFVVDADPSGSTIAPEAFVSATMILTTLDGVEAVRQVDPWLHGVTGSVLSVEGELAIEIGPQQ